ncbi:MAG: endonuclease III [Oscillospiraceae bacterium]|nr:endonuclease III [Oscillospiraceae bacterium]
MDKKAKTLLAVERLEKLYPEAICSLNYETPFQLLIATRLSAQCTDARVNIVTPALFSEFPDAMAMSNAPLESIENHIKSCGLYKTKAKDLIGIAKAIVNDYGGNIPDSLEELIKLPGVGRKTANLVCGDVFKKPAVVTDTHFIRICNRLGLVSTNEPLKVEKQMRNLLPPEKSNDFCHRTVLFGREYCIARNPKCEICPLLDFCPKKIKKQ